MAQSTHRHSVPESSRSAADVVDAGRAAGSPAYFQTCSGRELFLRRWRQSQRSRRNQTTVLFSLSPFLPPSLKKGFGSSATPIKFAKRVRERWLCVPAPCQSSGWNQTGPSGSALGCKKAPAESVEGGWGGEKKKKKHAVTQPAHDYF